VTESRKGPSTFHELLDVIDDELSAQVGIGRLGREVSSTPQQVRVTAELIAAAVMRVFKLEKRPQIDYGPNEDGE
jgi:hypothetical protein